MKHDAVHVYDAQKTFQENLLEGPFFSAEIPERVIPPRSEWKSLFGYPVMSCLGVPATPFVVNSRGVKLASDLGFDVITWKTIRSNATQARPFPQVSLLENARIADPNQKMVTTMRLPDSFEQFAFTVSIGNACIDLDTILTDMRIGMAQLKPGQILISSIYGVGQTRHALIQDFVSLAVRVKEVGVHVVEANLSCPNVDGLLYKDPDLVFEICNALTSALQDTPLAIKLGVFDSHEQMHAVLQAAARAGVRGITGINAVGMNVVDATGAEYFPGRPHAGVCGNPIRPFALDFISQVREVSNQNGYDFTILGCGGVTLPAHIDELFAAGADAVLCGAAALYNPYIMHEYTHQKKSMHILKRPSVIEAEK